jgi:hypothetical protein
MMTFFVVCATIGCAVMILQFLLAFLGVMGDIGGDVDAGGDVDFGADIGDLSDIGGAEGDIGHHADVATHHAAQGMSLAKLLTVQTIVAFLAFFGLTGVGVLRSGGSTTSATSMGVIVGFGVMYGVAYLMMMLKGMERSGNVDIRNAVGQEGRVYLKVPAENAGAGKVTVDLQGRRMEFQARTPGAELPTGSKVLVSRIVDNRTVEVQCQ